MQMHDVKPAHHLGESIAHGRRAIDPPKSPCWKIPNLDTVHIHRAAEWYLTFLRSIDVRREHVHLVILLGEGACKSVYGVDRTTIARCGQVGWNDVQDSHGAVRHRPINTSRTA